MHGSGIWSPSFVLNTAMYLYSNSKKVEVDVQSYIKAKGHVRPQEGLHF